MFNMEGKFIKVNDYIIQKEQIVWVNVEGKIVTIRINNGDSITNVTATNEDAQELLNEIWNLLN